MVPSLESNSTKAMILIWNFGRVSPIIYSFYLYGYASLPALQAASLFDPNESRGIVRQSFHTFLHKYTHIHRKMSTMKSPLTGNGVHQKWRRYPNFPRYQFLLASVSLNPFYTSLYLQLQLQLQLHAFNWEWDDEALATCHALVVYSLFLTLSSLIIYLQDQRRCFQRIFKFLTLWHVMNSQHKQLIVNTAVIPRYKADEWWRGGRGEGRYLRWKIAT